MNIRVGQESGVSPLTGKRSKAKTTTAKCKTPRKTKVLCGNQKPHVDKNLRKAIMKHSKLKNKANRTKL